MRLNTNMPALRAHNSILKNDRLSQLSSARLSTGKRLTSSADNPADYAISTKLVNQSAALASSSRNATFATSLTQTAEGAMNEIQNMLQRMHELAVQASNGTLNTDDREKMQVEIDNYLEEINAIADRTDYNGINLLSGAAGKLYEDLNSNVLSSSDSVKPGDYPYTVTKTATKTTVTTGGATGSIPDASLKGKVSVNGVEITLKGGETSDEILDMFTAASKAMGVTLVPGNPILSSMESIEYGSKYSIDISGDSDVLSALGLKSTTTVQGEDAEITINPPSDLSAAATYTADGNRISIHDINAKEIVFDVNAGFVGDSVINIKAYGLSLQIGTKSDSSMLINIPQISNETLNIDKLNVLNFDRAQEAIDLTDQAINSISAVRAKLGSYENRLNYTISSLDTTDVNVQKSLSRVRDTDMAMEMSNYTKYNLISQAAMSVLAQANQRPQMLLQLLQ